MVREQGGQRGEVHRIRLVILSTSAPWAKLAGGKQLSPRVSPSPSGASPESHCLGSCYQQAKASSLPGEFIF